MFVREESIHIDAPPEAVYDYVADIRRHPEWAKYNLAIQEIGEGRFESIWRMGPKPVRSIIQVELEQRPNRFVFLCDDELSSPHRWHFDISPEAGGSTVRYGFERTTDPLVIRILQPLVMWPLVGHSCVVTALSNIKRTVEQGQKETVSAPAAG